MLTILFTFILFAIFGFALSKQIKKYALYLYVLASIISLLSLSSYTNIFSLGYVAFGVFLLVMYMGIFDKGKFRNQLLGIRGEYAIIATIFLIPHAYGYIKYYLIVLGFLQNSLSFFAGLAALILVIPLTITSSRMIRSKLGFKLWKKIHRFSYLFYFIVSMHLILLNNDNMVAYIFIFGMYAILKVYVLIEDYFDKKKKLEQKNINHKNLRKIT